VIQSAIFTKLQSRLDEIADDLAQELDPVVEEAANMVADSAKNRVPTETGRLQESIRPIKFDTCKYNVVADAKAEQAKTALYYGIFVEYGTEAGGKGGGNAPAQPFMGPAAEEAQDEFEQMVNEKLRDL
jgi:HK97 gp10 family phage protein